MKRMMALVLSLVMLINLCASPAWGADEATEQAAQEFIAAYLSNDEGSIYGHVKGFDGSLSKMFDSEGAWNELSDEVQTRVNELLAAEQDGLSYEKLWEWTQGFLFMVEYLVIAEGDYEGYIISTDPNGGTLVDPDPPQNTYAIQPFTQEIWQRIVDAEEDFNALSDDAKAYLEKLMTEEGFGLNNGVQPADLPICNFEQLLAAAKANLAADDVEQAAQDFVDTYLSNDKGEIFGHVKGFDGSLSKMFDSEGAWNELSDEVQTRVNELLAAEQDGLSYEKLWEWTQGFLFMVEYLVIAEGDYEGYIISTDPNGGTLVDPDPPQNTYAIQSFTQEIWQRIVDAEEDFNALSDDAKAYLEKLMTEEGFGLNNKVQPADLPICNFVELLTAAKENLATLEQAAQEFVDTYLSNDEGSIYGHVKGFDGSLSKMFDSEGVWNELSDEVQTRVNELLAAEQDGLSYEKLWEWTQGFLFMVEYLVIAEGDYEGYIISTDPNGGTLVDPDPPQNTYAIQPFTQEIWQRIVDAEEDFNALSDDAKAYLEKLMTEEGFGLNNGVQPADLPICNFEQLLEKAKENLESYEAVGSKLEAAGIDPVGVDQMTADIVQAIADGAKIEVEVKAEMVDKDTVSSEKQTAFEQEVEEQGYTGYNIDRYLEIEVLMTVQGFDPVLASRTAEPIWVDLGEAKSGYDYAVLREHAGELTLLVGDQYVVVRGDGHIYVKSDLFSTFALLAKAKSTGVTIGGTVTSFLAEEEIVTIRMYVGNEDEVVYSTTCKGNTALYSIENVAAGTYTMKVSKANHVTRECEVVVGTEAVAKDVKICPKGDVNLDGEVNADDLTALARHVAKIEILEDSYALLCSDVDDNGTQSADDLTKLARYVAKIITSL